MPLFFYVNIVAILRPDSTRTRELKHDAAEAGILMNATNGKKVGSLIVLRNNHIVLSPLQPKTLAKLLEANVSTRVI